MSAKHRDTVFIKGSLWLNFNKKNLSKQSLDKFQKLASGSLCTLRHITAADKF